MTLAADLRTLDWTDIALHLAGAVAIGAVLALPPWTGLTANALFWLGREALQRIEKGQPMSRLVTEPQVLLEWAAPGLVAPAAYVIAGLVA